MNRPFKGLTGPDPGSNYWAKGEKEIEGIKNQVEEKKIFIPPKKGGNLDWTEKEKKKIFLLFFFFFLSTPTTSPSSSNPPWRSFPPQDNIFLPVQRQGPHEKKKSLFSFLQHSFPSFFLFSFYFFFMFLIPTLRGIWQRYARVRVLVVCVL